MSIAFPTNTAYATGIASVFVVGSLGSTVLFLIGVLLVKRLSGINGARVF